MPDDDERPIQWPWVIGCCLAGIGLVFLAWHFSLAPETEFISVVLAEFGVAVFLAGLLFLLERKFVRAVSGAATAAATTAATKAATTAATNAATDAVQDISERIDRLEGRVSDGLTQQANEDDLVIGDASQQASFRNVANSMRLAVERGAAKQAVTVLGGTSPHAPRIMFELLSGGVDNYGQSIPESILISHRASHNPDGGMGVPILQTEWQDGTTFTDAMLQFIKLMQSKGFAKETKLIQVDRLFADLMGGLADAVKGRRDADGAWRSTGVLYEILGPDWAVTSQGVEEREHKVVLAAKDFPAPDQLGRQTHFSPSAPDWADAAWWNLAVSEGMKWRKAFTYGSMRDLF